MRWSILFLGFLSGFSFCLYRITKTFGSDFEIYDEYLLAPLGVNPDSFNAIWGITKMDLGFFMSHSEILEFYWGLYQFNWVFMTLFGGASFYFTYCLLSL